MCDRTPTVLTLDQSVYVPSGPRVSSPRGGRSRRRRRASRSDRAVEVLYPEAYSCPRALTIPGLDASYIPGKGWTECI